MFGRKTAKKLDAAATALHNGGKKIAGQAGGRAGDAIANAAIAPIRSRINEDCTRCARGKCKAH
ncbi:hypothetical protein [Streptomyces cinereoruber]|uniref:hypothetical protein n=1 Tax=Streptomyces cinereoruber TaxID=67260 RepID=UPI00362F5716